MVNLQSRSLRVYADALEYLDQTRLPQAEEWVRCDSPEAWQIGVQEVLDGTRGSTSAVAFAIGTAYTTRVQKEAELYLSSFPDDDRQPNRSDGPRDPGQSVHLCWLGNRRYRSGICPWTRAFRRHRENADQSSFT